MNQLLARQLIHRKGKDTGITTKTKALAIASAAADKKALDVVLIDMRKMSSVCDYFVVASGTSTTHVRAVAEHIERVLKDKGARVRHVEGAREAMWILLDCGDIVAHIFLDETRRFYDLERLWGDAPQERFKEAKRVPKKAKKTKKLARPKVAKPRRKKATRPKRRK